MARAGFAVTVIALQDDTASETDGVAVIPLPLPRHRLQRMLRTARVLRLALRQAADVYAIHDPELLPVAVLLRLLRRRPIIYDVHEDVPASIRNRRWLLAPLRPLVAVLYRLVERLSLRFIAGLTLADHAYKKYYGGRKTLTVLNYPLTSYAGLYHEFSPPADGPPVLIYTGSITRLRGLYDMIEIIRRVAKTHPDVRLQLVGPVSSDEERRHAGMLIERYELADRIEFTGPVSHGEVHRLILRADVGLALLHPDPNYLSSLPTKMFEYMMMGRPVIVSDFPMWAEIVRDAQCGHAVHAGDLDAAVAAVCDLLGDAERRQRMGADGRHAVLEKFNWDREGERMVAFYREIMLASARG